MNVVPMATPMKMQTKRARPAASASLRRAKAASGASALRIATASRQVLHLVQRPAIRRRRDYCAAHVTSGVFFVPLGPNTMAR
jgi:hypothetical protein